jgi:hypothetical protein
MLCIKIFMYLQVLDFVTTIAGFRLGLIEGSPIVHWVTQTHVGPVLGVAASKLLAFMLGGICCWLRRHSLLRKMNYWYVAAVTWNFTLLIASSKLLRG